MIIKKYKTGIYINEQGLLVDIIGWGEDHHEYEIIGVYESSVECVFTYNIRKNWED